MVLIEVGFFGDASVRKDEIKTGCGLEDCFEDRGEGSVGCYVCFVEGC